MKGGKESVDIGKAPHGKVTGQRPWDINKVKNKRFKEYKHKKKMQGRIKRDEEKNRKVKGNRITK